MSEVLKFVVDSALLSEIGEKLVENVHLALLELVKNSYDADSIQVHINFENQKFGGPKIEVSDNGTGMTFEEVQNYWMRIATTNKVEEKYSKGFGRPKTGAKGIGRFCCRRLGKHLELTTTAKLPDGKYQRTNVVFPWEDFTPGQDLTEIECIGEVKTFDKAETGTKLTIKHASKNEWTDQGFQYLKRQMVLLVVNRGQRRKGYDYDAGFNIDIDAPGTKLDSRNFREEVFDASWGTLTAEVTDKGEAKYTLNALGVGKKTITAEEEFPELAGIKLTISILTEEKDESRNPKLLSKFNVRSIVKDWGGIFVFQNGFRIFPYGEDDWLSIDKDRALSKGSSSIKQINLFAGTFKNINPIRFLLLMLGHRNYLGDVVLPSEIKGFEKKANREGFLDSPEFDSLVNFVRFGIDWSSIYRSFISREKKREEAEEAKELFVNLAKEKIEPEKLVEKAINYIEKEAENIKTFLPTDKKSEFVSAIKGVKKAIITQDKSTRDELHHLRLIASTSPLLITFAHQVRSLLALLTTTSSSLKNIISKIPEKEAKEIKEIIEDIEDTKARFTDLMELTSTVGVHSKNAREKRLALHEYVERAVKCFNLITKKYEIKVDYSKVPTNILVGPMLEAELYAILLNPLSNAIKATIAGNREKEISITAVQNDENTKINIKDTGVGLDPKYFNDVFIPFISDPDQKLYKKLKEHINPEDNVFVGSGSGMGLSIIKDIIRIRQGDIYFKNVDGKWKANLEVILP